MSREQFLAQYGHEGHIEHAMKSDDFDVKYSVAQNPSIPQHHINTIMSNKDEWGMHLGLAKNPTLPTEHINTLAQHRDCEVQHHALMNKQVSPELVHKAINNPKLWSFTARVLVKHSPHITKEHLKQIVYSKHSYKTNKTPYYESDVKDAAQERLMREHGED